MARIRTIKPEFFTSDDICALSPLARLLYVGLWCEADREGRLVWTPVHSMISTLVGQGLSWCTAIITMRLPAATSRIGR